MSSQSKEMKAVELISPWKFHRIFTVPATENHGPLNVTYSISGVDVGEGEDVPTILFCGGMFATRWLAPWMEYLSRKEKVRIIHIDRPGFGASTPVPLALRIPTFLETVPLLLTHLEIAHISIACQSAGTFYALNLLTHHPELLSPINPSITFFSPWIHQSHSSVSFLTIASMLPNALLNHWNKVMSFMMNTLQPTFAVSGGAFTMVTSTFKDQVKTEKQKEEDAKKCLEGYGLPLDVKDELDGLIFKYVFAENTEGANDEARLCLRSVPGISWDAAEDYEECVKVLAEAWGRRVEEGGKPLSVSVHLPEEDIMVGDKGMMYFEECWKEENKGRGMKVECTRWKGTDHETTSSASHGAVGRMYSLVKGLRTVDSGMGGDVA